MTDGPFPDAAGPGPSGRERRRGLEQENGFAPEDLARLGLGRRPGGGPTFDRILPRAFLRALRPPWPGLGRTLLMAILLTLIGRTIVMEIWSHRMSFPQGWDIFPELDRVAFLLRGLSVRLHRPLGNLGAAAEKPYALGGGFLALPLTLAAGALLLRRRGGGPRVGLALLLLACGAVGATWALAGGWPQRGWPAAGSPAYPVLSAAGSAAGAFLLLRPARRAGAGVLFAAAFPSLLVLGVVAANLQLLFLPPDTFLGIVLGTIGGDRLSTMWGFSGALEMQRASVYTVVILGFPLVLAPALVVVEGLGLRAALATLARALRRRPAALLLSHLVLYALIVVPLPWLVGLLLATAFPSFQPALVVRVAMGAILGGLDLGIFVYATALFARALRAADPAARGPGLTGS